MSAFTTPSRLSTTTAAATRHGGSSTRRVVRSALETLMDTATPELPGRAGRSNDVLNTRAGPHSAKRHRPTTTAATGGGGGAPSTSQLSVTYTTAAPGTQRTSLGGRHTSADTTAPNYSKPTSSSSPPRSNNKSSRSSSSSSSSVEVPSRVSLAHTQLAEPSALAFLSPQSKAARPSTTSSRHHRAHPSQVHTVHDDNDDKDDESDDDAASLAEQSFVKGEKHNTRGPRRTPLFAAPAPASPSRSLYSDVEAAQQQPSPVEESDDADTKSPSPIVADADNSFVDDDAEEVEEAGEEEAAGLVPAAEVNAVITAALRRYEKERDAEEEAVLRQVSAEVEAQATRYAALVDANRSTCNDNAQLQAQLTAATKSCAELEQALQSARQTQQTQREAMKRLEVELYHARDAQQHTAAQQHAQLESEAAEWETVRRRYEKRHATLEAQLSQVREELQEKDAQVTELLEQVAQQEKEMHTMRQRTTQREKAVEEEYTELHQRMQQLGRNMSSMETTLRERDSTIAQLRAQLVAAVTDHRDRSDVARQWDEEKKALEAALSSTRESLQKQTDDVRKRMHRLTSLEQQKETLKVEVDDARQTLSTSIDEHARVLTSLESLIEEVKRLTTAAQRPCRRDRSRSIEKASDANHRDAPAVAAAITTTIAHPDDTLVYEDDSTDDIGDFSSVADTHAEEDLLTSAASEEGEEEDGVDGEDQSFAASTSTPKPSRQLSPSATGASTSACTASSSTTANDKSTSSVKRLSQLLHHSMARAHTLVRELRRRVTALAKLLQPQQQLRQRTASQSLSITAMPGGSDPVRRTARTRSIAANLADTSSSHYTTADRRDIVRKLEQACRYLKSELTAAQSQLSAAQAECQWRTVSMKKWEDDVQASRRDVLNLEKERLTSTTERETLEIVKQELEQQLAESQQACTAAEASIAALTTAQKTAQEALEAATAAKAAVASGLETEQAKTARLTATVAELTTTVAALTDELALLKEKHKATLGELQDFRAHEAQQRLKEQQESRAHSAELTELRTAVAQLHVSAGASEEERARLHATAASLRRRLDVCTETAALQADLETTTLLTIARIVGAAPLVTQDSAKEKKDTSSNSNGSGNGGLVNVMATSPTEKRLFDVEEPSVEEVVVEESDAVAAVVRARLRRRSPSARTPHAELNGSSVKKRSASSGTARHPHSRNSPHTTSQAASPLSHGVAAAEASSSSSSSVQLVQLRQHVVAAVQRVVLELAQLRTAVHVASPASSPSQSSKRPFSKVFAPPTTAAGGGGAAEEGTWYGADVAFTGGPSTHSAYRGDDDVNGGYSPSSPPPFEKHEVMLMDHRSPSTSPSTAPRSSATYTPSHLRQPPQTSITRYNSNTNSNPRAARQRHMPAAATPSAEDPQRSHPSASPSPVAHLQPYELPGTSSQRRHELTSSPAHSSTTEHVYNVSPWTPSRGLTSPSARPPVTTADTAATKAWSEVRRSTSMEDGLSGGSHSATRGDVDGSGSPARPPSLRTQSNAR